MRLQKLSRTTAKGEFDILIQAELMAVKTRDDYTIIVELAGVAPDGKADVFRLTFTNEEIYRLATIQGVR